MRQFNGGFSQTRYFCSSQFYLSGECMFKCQIKAATIRALWLFTKDNEEQRMGALFRQKGVCWDIRHHRVTLHSQAQRLFIHNSFVVSGSYSSADHILLSLCLEADLLFRDVHIYFIHKLSAAHMLQAHVHY